MLDDRVAGDGDLDVAGAVGVGVAADGLRQRAGGARQPPADLRGLGEQIRPCGRGQIAGAGSSRPERQLECARTRSGRREQPLPDPAVGQVDRQNVGAPGQQRRERPQLGAGAEHRETLVTQVEPGRFGDDPTQRGREARLDHAGAHPGVELAQQAVAA